MRKERYVSYRRQRRQKSDALALSVCPLSVLCLSVGAKSLRGSRAAAESWGSLRCTSRSGTQAGGGGGSRSRGREGRRETDRKGEEAFTGLIAIPSSNSRKQRPGKLSIFSPSLLLQFAKQETPLFLSVERGRERKTGSSIGPS